MKRKIIYLLSSMFIFGNTFVINAQPNLNNNIETIIKNKENAKKETNLKEKLKELDNKYENIELILDYAERKTFNNDTRKPVLEFKTIEEFEIFLEKNNNENKPKIININKTIDKDISNYSYNGVETLTKWMPLNVFNLACYFNIDVMFSYDYDKNDKKYFVSTNGAKSYTSGLNIALDWVETSLSQNITNSGQTIESEIKGYWINGIKIGDIEIGFKDKMTFLGVLNIL